MIQNHTNYNKKNVTGTPMTCVLTIINFKLDKKKNMKLVLKKSYF